MVKNRRIPAKSAVRKYSISILALLIAVPTLLYSLSVNTPSGYAKNAGTMFASVGASMGASVGANPDNTLAAQLAAEQERLNQERVELAAMRHAQSQNGLSLSDILGVSSFFISIILLALVALNFYYDKRREKSPILPRKFFVDLR